MSFDPIELIRRFNSEGVRYLLIGRQAVVQYGAPLFSFDYDFWIHREDRRKAYSIIESFGLQGEPSKRPPIAVFDDDEGNKVDVFSPSRMTNGRKGIDLDFESVFSASVVKEDPVSDFYVRVPAIKDLIKLKQLGETRPKDAEDIEYLLSVLKKKNRVSGN